MICKNEIIKMKIAIFGKNFQESFHDAIYKIFEKLNKNKIDILVYKPFYKFITENLFFNPRVLKMFENETEIDENTDLIFSIGGDGTFLECASLLKRKKIPIIGINSGRLGFLASISKKEVEVALNNLLAKKYTIEERSLVEVDIDCEHNFFKNYSYALNELTVQKKDNTSMINVEVYLNGEYLNTYWADGLIVSTPTGSSAYSLSAGGPIILPGSSNFVITPIAPHTLTVRPIVVPDSVELEIIVHGRSQKFLAALDSRTAFVKNSTKIKVKKADFSISMVKFNDSDYFSILRKKLMWGLDIRN